MLTAKYEIIMAHVVAGNIVIYIQNKFEGNIYKVQHAKNRIN